MNRRRLLFLTSGISLLVLVGVYVLVQGVYVLVQGNRITVTPNEGNGPRFDRFHLTDVRYSHYDRDGKLYSVRMDEVAHRKWKIGPYTVNPVKEIKITNLRIEVAQRNGTSDKKLVQDAPDPFLRLPLRGLLWQFLAGQKLGFVRGVYIRGFEYLVVRQGHEQLTVSATRATLAVPSGLVTFEDGFSISSNHGQELRTRKGHWRAEEAVFLIPEGYVFKDTAGTHEGLRAVFAVDPSGRIKEVEEAVWTSKAPLGE